MHWLAILLAALLYTSAVKSSLPFFGPGGIEYEVKNQSPSQIQAEENQEGGKLEHTDWTLTEIDEDEEEEEGVKEYIKPEEETQREAEEKEEGKKEVGSKEPIEQKEETQWEMEEEEGEEGDMDDEDGGDMEDEEEGEEDGKERHQDWKELGNKDMDAEESEESRRLEVKPGTKSRRGGGRHHGNRGRGRPGQYPFVAYVELIQCKCTGFLLTDSWILTSSHCFLVDPLFQNLQAGRVYMGTTSVPVSKSSLKHVQLRIISEVKVIPSEGEEPKKGGGMSRSALGGGGMPRSALGGGEDYPAVEGEEDRGDDEMPCKLSNRTQGAMQESRRCIEVKGKGKRRGAKGGKPPHGEGRPFVDGDQEPPLEEEEEDARREVDDAGVKARGRSGYQGAPGDKTGGGEEGEEQGENEEDGDEDDEEVALGEQERPAGSGELALVRVDDKFEMNDYVGFVRLMKLPFPGSLECRTVGFVGNQSTGERKRLRWRKLEVWNGTKCNFMHSLALDKDSLCSKGPKGRPGCGEDIGGPVVCQEAAAAFIAHSLSVYGATAIYDCQKRVTNVFVMGGAHLPWIQSIVPDLPLPVDPPENKTTPLRPLQARSFGGSAENDGRNGGVTTTTFSLTSGSSGLSGVLAGCGFLLHRHI